MATLVTERHSNDHNHEDPTITSALRSAWTWWITMALIPFALFIYVIWSLADDNVAHTRSPASNVWFISCMVYLMIAGPVSVAIKSRIHRSYYAGQPVDPQSYVRGMVIMWAALTIGGVASLIGALVTHSLLPNLIAGLVGFVFFLFLYPSGHALTHHGRHEDPSLYKEPM